MNELIGTTLSFSTRAIIVAVTIGVFILGAIVALLWIHSNKLNSKQFRHIQLVLSGFFTLIALLVTGDLLYVAGQFDKYVTQTLPRDEAQENCEKAILHTLRIWAQERQDLDIAQRAREEALLPFYKQFRDHGTVDPQTAQDIINKTEQLEDARNNLVEVDSENPILDCKLGVDHGS